MVVGCGFKAEYYFFKTVLYLDCICLDEKPFKSFLCVFKDQPLKESLSCSCAKECIVFVFGNINAYNEIVLLASYLFL